MHYKLKCSKKHCQIVSDCLNVEKSVVKTTSENKYEHNLWERNQNNNSEKNSQMNPSKITNSTCTNVRYQH